jgi:hypothetical protein
MCLSFKAECMEEELPVRKILELIIFSLLYGIQLLVQGVYLQGILQVVSVPMTFAPVFFGDMRFSAR